MNPLEFSIWVIVEEHVNHIKQNWINVWMEFRFGECKKIVFLEPWHKFWVFRSSEKERFAHFSRRRSNPDINSFLFDVIWSSTTLTHIEKSDVSMNSGLVIMKGNKYLKTPFLKNREEIVMVFRLVDTALLYYVTNSRKKSCLPFYEMTEKVTPVNLWKELCR